MFHITERLFGPNWNHFFSEHFKSWGFNDAAADILNAMVFGFILLIIAYLFNKIFRWIIVKFISSVARKTEGKFDDLLLQNRAFTGISNLITVFLIVAFLPWILQQFPDVLIVTKKILDALSVLLIIIILRSFLNAGKDYLNTLKSFRDKPLESYLQIFMIFTWIIGIILMVSIFSGKSIWQFLTALGALSAIILLLFKDTILGFVATIQISVNDTVRIGDWITMSKHGADGTVTAINLTSVNVQNFDNTISTIPTYYLTSEAFQNWRGMEKSPGRRILRSIYIKMSSVRFLDEADIERFSKIELVKNYIVDRKAKNDAYNAEKNIDNSLKINGHNQTNLGLFRAYINEYLENDPNINKEMLYTCRQLQPTQYGIPLEIFAFSLEKVFKNYEAVQASIFDHLIAAAQYFDLEIFESPSGKDFEQIAQTLAHKN